MRAQQRKADPKNREARFVRACAVETHMDMSQEPFCGNLHGQCRTRSPQEAFGVQIYRKLPNPKPTGASLCENLQEKCRAPFARTV